MNIDVPTAPAADDAAEDLDGELRTQSGPRTVAPMWPRPLLTEGEWAIYTALWSFGNWSGMDAIPKHQTLADRAWCERGTAATAVRRFVELGLIRRERRQRPDKSQTSNRYVLVDVCPDELVPRLVELAEERMADQEAKRAKRGEAKRKYRKAGRPAETTPGDDDQESGEEGGTSQEAPPADGPPDWAQDKGGTSPEAPRGTSPEVPRGTSGKVPVTYPGFDLPKKDQSPSTTSATHAADTPASSAADPAEVAADAPAAAAVPAAEGGKTLDDETKTKLTTAVDNAVAHRRRRTGWARPAVVAEVQAALEAGHPVDLVVSTLAEIAKDLDGTDYPTRLVPYLAAKAKRTAAAAPPPYRHQPAAPCEPGCDCWKHERSGTGAQAISETTAALLAATRAGLPAGKPLSRRGGVAATPPGTKTNTGDVVDVEAESGTNAAAA